MKYMLFLDEVMTTDAARVGAKAFGLAQLSQTGLNVPPAFIVTTEAYEEFSSTVPSAIFLEELETAFKRLNSPRVAVRSSATTEDSAAHSWAGQLQTYLNTTHDELRANIRKCWDSLSSDRAAAYGKHTGVEEKSSVAVIVQSMIESEVSGVIFTVNPITKDSKEILIEAVHGLGESLAQGEVTPVNYCLNKQDASVISYHAGDQDSDSLEHLLQPTDLYQLAALARKIEQFYTKPQDIEWAKSGGKFFILQSRPITTL